MKPTRWIRLLWPLTVVAAFALGYWFSQPAHQAADRELTLVKGGPVSGSLLSVPSNAAQEDSEKGAQENRGGADVRSKKSLTKEEIDRITAEAIRDPSELNRSLAFSKLLDSLTAENAPAIMEALRRYDADDDEWELFRYAWASVDAEAAMEDAMSLEGRDRREAVSATVTGWASKDPTAALAWLNAIEDEDEQRGYRDELVEGMTDHDIDLATEYVLELAAQGDERAERYLETVTRGQLQKGDINAAVAWSEALPDGELKGEAMERVADRYVNEDPEQAAAWAEKYASVDYGSQMIEEVGDEWSERDPEAAVSWLQTLPEGRGQAEGLESAMDEWAERDPTSASEFLVKMPNSAMKDAAVSGFAREVVEDDPQAAIAWASTIGEQELRLRTLTRTAREWFERDHNAALAWLETSDLPQEAREQVLRRGRGRD